VLVGHSFGGLNTLLYADRFPQEVAGMVEVDPSVADLGPRIDAVTHGAFTKFFASQGARYQRCAANVGTGYDVRSTALAKCIDPRIPQLGPAVWAAQLRIERAPAFQRAQASEIENIYSLSAQQVRAASRSLGDIPLVILTEGVPARTASAVTRMEYGIWTELHGQFAALSTRGVHETIPNAPHNIQLARPDVVIAAVASVLTMIRSAGEVPR
jgi:pimeloyl-ACP methyl ester carboxylesterase